MYVSENRKGFLMIPNTAAQIAEALDEVNQRVANMVQAASAAQLEAGDAESWSAVGYLKHLIISVKPISKLIGFKPEDVIRRFGETTHAPRTYEDVKAMYFGRLAEGVRAEDYENVLPTAYRFPDSVVDQHAHLREAWLQANQRIIDMLPNWSDDALDRAQVLHPAIGMISMREMLYFTVIHNRLHAGDIEKALAAERA